MPSENLELGEPRSQWPAAIADLGTVHNRLALLEEIALHTNQTQTLRDLAGTQELWRGISVQVTLFGRIGTGVTEVAQQLSNKFGERMHATAIEAAAYAELTPDVWETARVGAAVVFLVPAGAPLFDDTREVVAREFGTVAEKVFLVVIASPQHPPGLADSIAPEVRQIVTSATVCTAYDMPGILDPFLTANYLKPLVAAMEIQIAPIVLRLEPIASAFSALLATDPSELGQRLEFVQRDLQALQTVSTQAQETLQARSQAFLSGVANQIVSLSTAMHQKAEAVVQSAAIPHDVLSNQDSRTRFGKDLTATARAVGFREFDTRVQAIAASLESARSLTLAQMDQVRDEAEAHLEELRENIGADLFRTFLKPPLDSAVARPFDVPLDPGSEFAATVTQVLQSVRAAAPEIPFAANWAGRIESMFRSEMTANTTAGWNTRTIDGQAAVEIAQLWEDTVKPQCGLLIGRIDALCEMVRRGLESLRLKNLQFPTNTTARALLGAVYFSYSGQLKKMRESAVTIFPTATT